MSNANSSESRQSNRIRAAHQIPAPLPRRRSLIHETVATLRTWISSGALGEVLPGELQLKNRLGIGRDTLRQALEILTTEGWISAAVKGRQRRVQIVAESRAASTATDPLPVTFLSPHPIEHRLTLMDMEETRVQLARQGRSLHFISPRIFNLKHPERQLERLVLAHPSAAWILYITGEPIQRWFERHRIPAFLYELPFPGVTLPYVAPDWENAAFDAGLKLIREGHRIIAILEFEERRPGLIAEESGLRKALEQSGVCGRIAVFKDDRSPFSVARSLETAFSLKERPTALVLTRAAQVLTCYSWLAMQGIRVPADVSIISLPSDSWFSDFYPPVCHYKSDSQTISGRIAERVLDLVKNGRTERRSVGVKLNYASGKSIGQAAVL